MLSTVSRRQHRDQARIVVVGNGENGRGGDGGLGQGAAHGGGGSGAYGACGKGDAPGYDRRARVRNAIANVPRAAASCAATCRDSGYNFNLDSSIV